MQLLCPVDFSRPLRKCDDYLQQLHVNNGIPSSMEISLFYLVRAYIEWLWSCFYPHRFHQSYRPFLLNTNNVKKSQKWTKIISRKTTFSRNHAGQYFCRDRVSNLETFKAVSNSSWQTPIEVLFVYGNTNLISSAHLFGFYAVSWLVLNIYTNRS